MNSAETGAWVPAPTVLALPAEEIHVWRARLDHGPEAGASLLSDDEQQRAGAFHFGIDRRRFVASRIVLRSVLSRYVGTAAAQLRFTKGRHGKPRLAHPAGVLHFNLSHSGELLLVAVARHREVGVDVEMVRENIPVQMLADHHFTPTAAASVRALSPEMGVRKFYEIWTQTEAQLKASGLGLSQGTQVAEPARWTVHALTPGEGYAAAVATDGAEFQTRCYEWTE